MLYTLSKIAQHTNAEIIGDETIQISGVATIETASAGDITFAGDVKNIALIRHTKASAVIVPQKQQTEIAQLVVKNVDAALIRTLELFAPQLPAAAPGVHKTAIADSSAQIDSSASIGPYVHIAAGVKIAAGVVIGSGCYIGVDSKIGADTRLDCNVTVYHNCIIGSHCRIKACSVIGGYGFGYSFLEGRHQHIPHNGGVIVEDYVDIGSCVCIDRAKFGNTIIGAGSKIDNLVQIAHNVKIGRCCLIAGQAAMAGSCELGDGVVLAGQVGLKDHVKIGCGTQIGAQAGVMNDIGAGLQAVGSPAVDFRQKIKETVAVQKLPEALRELKQLVKRIEALEQAAKDNSW